MAKNLEELRAENPALAEQLMAEARAAVSAASVVTVKSNPQSEEELKRLLKDQTAGLLEVYTDEDAVKAERQRIQEIDALASLFDSETIHAAKYGDHPCTAQEMVYQAAQKASQQGKQFLAALEADTAASGAQDVGAANGAGSDGTGGIGGEDTPQAMAAQAKLDAKAFNERKKEVR